MYYQEGGHCSIHGGNTFKTIKPIKTWTKRKDGTYGYKVSRQVVWKCRHSPVDVENFHAEKAKNSDSVNRDGAVVS